VKHLSDALDDIRRSEYNRVTGDDRSFIKGQRYVLLSRRENLTDDKRKNLERLLQANARLNVAYLLREQFEQLWDYADAEHARLFFDAWRDQLRDQDLAPYEKFAAMIEKHWDGIAAYCQPTHQIPLGFVEGFNNKIRDEPNLNFCSNSACSRLSSAIKVLNEFYRIAFRRKIYRSIKELQADLDAWMAATTTNVRIRSVGAYGNPHIPTHGP
jgi:hypothetical protein